MSALTERKTGLFSGNALKILAAVFMLVDHTGLLFFPGIAMFRIVGRLAFPVFSFMIAEGCRYTRNKLRYFLTIFSLAVFCQMVYTIADGGSSMSVLVTFSLSIPLILVLQQVKRNLFGAHPHFGTGIAWVVAFAACVAAVYWLNQQFIIDYGFWGCMLPVFGSLLHFDEDAHFYLRSLDTNALHALTHGVGMLFLTLKLGGNQIFSLLAIPLLLLYSGKRGKWKMKYFFYIFYPLHLALLQGIFWLLYG